MVDMENEKRQSGTRRQTWDEPTPQELEGDLVEALIRKYRPMVVGMARKRRPWGPQDEDLIQCGLIGLWRAAEAWDQERPFVPLARQYIKGGMADYFRAQARQLRTLPLEGREEAAPDELEGVELRVAVEGALPAGSRQRALLLALLDGLSLSEAARGVGLRPARARQMARRALRRVSDFMES